MTHWKSLIAASAVAAVAGTAVVAEGLYVPNLSYRTGPFAATGIPLMNGQRDYFEMLNARDGGIGGVMVDYDECETGYSTEKGVECYERTKDRAIVTQPWSTGITLQVLPKTNVDEIPILAPGYGFSPMSDGTTFQWAFNPPASYWDGMSMILQEISGGDLSSLAGKKIAHLHLDHPYGKEPLPLLEAMGEAHGFEVLPIPVGISEMQNQSAQWLQIRRESPDYVIMWGWGAMNAGAITEAVKTRYPMDQFIGVWWSGHSDDLQLVGEKGAGYRAISWSLPNPDAPVMQEIRELVGDKSLADAEEQGEVFYGRGVIISAILAEAIKVAQDMHGTAEIGPGELRDGLANLNFTSERIDELGLSGMMAPFSTNCGNHTGHSGAWMIQWDGEMFVQASDLLTADRDAIMPLEAEKAAEYAEANAPWPVNEACEAM
jgi:branched-chain amino acid transport system substrate-binding protein